MFTRPIPKVTSNGSLLPSLDSATAHQDSWSVLMELIDKLGPVCLKPLSKSASSDAFLVGDAKQGTESVKLTLGLAVKNYGSTEFSSPHLSRECQLFNRMFDRVDCNGRLNILFICCTHYGKELSSKFNSKYFFIHKNHGFPNIGEVILLDVSNAERRAKFFGVEDDLSVFVENVVKKAEVEYQDPNSVV